MRHCQTILLLLSMVLLNTKRVSSSTTLSCFSVSLLDLPSFGFSQEEEKVEKDQAEGAGRQVTSSFDACFWGLLSFVVFSVVPAGLKSEVSRVQERINAALPSPHAGSTGFPDYPQQIEDGNRRLDLNVYNYVDTSGPSNDLSISPPPPLFTPPPPPGFPANSVYEFIHQSSYGVGQASSYNPSTYQQPPDWAQQPSHLSGGQAAWGQSGLGMSKQGYDTVPAPIYSPPISSSLLQDDWEGKLMVDNSGSSGLASPVEQDYDDIDYTSGGLVTFHTSLSK